jgi:hypothetical protein
MSSLPEVRNRFGYTPTMSSRVVHLAFTLLWAVGIKLVLNDPRPAFSFIIISWFVSILNSHVFPVRVWRLGVATFLSACVMAGVFYLMKRFA